MNATARPSPSAITQALVPYPPRDRPRASQRSRSAEEPPFERHRLLSGGPGCWCRPETSSRVEPRALGRGAAGAPTRPGAPSGGRSEPPATRDQAQPGRRATWPRSDAARRSPRLCGADPLVRSCPWAGTPRSEAPGSSRLRPSASLLLPSGRAKRPSSQPVQARTGPNVRKIFEFARKQPCVLFFDEFDALARSRDDTSEHNELRRVVNSLLIFIDRIKPKGFLIAASNLD